jgi:hypothetical protein
MKVAIIDNRGGDILREEHGEKILGADLVLYIQADEHVDVQFPQNTNIWHQLGLTSEDQLKAVYVEAVNRDVISGERSAEINEERVRQADEVEASQTPLEKAKHAWEGPDHSGTEEIHGPGVV